MPLDVGSRFGHVGVDADDVDAARAVIFGELFDALAICSDHWALRRKEDNHRAVLALERSERMLMPINIRQLEICDRLADRDAVRLTTAESKGRRSQHKRESEEESESVVLHGS